MGGLTGSEVIGINGKTMCGSDDKGSAKSAVHLVSAYAKGYIPSIFTIEMSRSIKQKSP